MADGSSSTGLCSDRSVCNHEFLIRDEESKTVTATLSVSIEIPMGSCKVSLFDTLVQLNPGYKKHSSQQISSNYDSYVVINHQSCFFCESPATPRELKQLE